MSTTDNKICITGPAELGVQGREWVHTGKEQVIRTLLVATLMFSACVPIAPAGRATTDPATTAASSSTTDGAAPAVDAAITRVEALLDNLHAAGIFAGVVLIAQDGEIILHKGWGMADREQALPNTPQTSFRLYEMTVQFTAAALLLLEQEGKLSMADPICNYLDNCPAAWEAVTIHHILSHTSGIPDYFDIASAEAYKLTREGATPEQLVALFHDEALAFAPGERRAWGHSGFVLSGLIIERVSGQTYSDFMQKSLFAPLGMSQTGYGDPVEGLALGYTTASSTNPVAFDVSSLYASGGLHSTAEDLFRWNEALYNAQLLDETQLQKMLTWHADIDGDQGSGYGIVVGEYFGRKWAGNGGFFDGYGATIGRYLDERITVVLVGNQDMEIFAISEQVDKSFFGAE